MFKYIWIVILIIAYISVWIKWVIEVYEIIQINRCNKFKFLLDDFAENEFIVGWLILNLLIIWLGSLGEWLFTKG